MARQHSTKTPGGWTRHLGRAARLTVCVAAVGWIIYDIDWRQLWAVLLQARWSLIMLALVAFGPTPVIISLRLKWLLAVHDIHLTTLEALKVTFAGNFVIWSLPFGTGGGDSVKAYYIARDTPHKHEAVMTVFFDRVIGVSGLVLLSGVVVLSRWRDPAFAVWGQIIGGLILGLGIAGAVYYSYRMRALLRLEKLVSKLPLSAHLRRLDRAVFVFRHRPGRVAGAFLLTAMLQLNAIFVMFLIGWALGMGSDRPIRDFLVFVGYTPICFLAGALPIGAMEITFSKLLADSAGLGTPEQAVSLSLLGGRIVQLIWALPGALVFLGGRPEKTDTELIEAAREDDPHEAVARQADLSPDADPASSDPQG